MTRWRRVALIVLGLVAFLVILVPLARRSLPLDICPDSASYHFLAVNLLLGRGYYPEPMPPLADYGPASQQCFPDAFRHASTPAGRSISTIRGPGYPVFVAAIYRLHGVRPDLVVPYQIVLMALTGALLVWIGYGLFGWLGAIAAVPAGFLLVNNPEATYSIPELLTETLATFLLTASVLLAVWAKRGGPLRESCVALGFVAAVLTRQALLPTAVLYGLFLLWPLGTSWKRALAFALPCVIAFAGWSLFISLGCGKPVFLAETGNSNFLGGLDPVACAKAAGLPVPALDEASLEPFWVGCPGGFSPAVASDILHRAPGRWPEILTLLQVKLKIGFFWLPRPLLACMLLGTALAASVGFGAIQGRADTELSLSFQGLIRSRVYLECLLWTAAIVLLLLLWGYSHPALQLFCLLVVPALLLARTGIAARGESPPRVSNLWLSSWFLGYLILTLMTFGARRFMRPYLPVFYLCAVLAIPLLLTSLACLRHVTVNFAGRWVFSSGRGCGEQRDTSASHS